MTSSFRHKTIILTLVIVIAVLAVTGASLAVWISGGGEGSSYDFVLDGWDDPSVRYLLLTATADGGESVSLAYDDAKACFVATSADGTAYGGALSDLTVVGYYGIIEELLIPGSIIVESDGGDPYGDGGVLAAVYKIVAVDMAGIEQDGGEALRLISELTIGANVATISAHSFSYCDHLTKVTFEPSSVAVSVGDYAFLRCPLLTEVIEDGRTVTRGEGSFGK